MSRNRDRQDRRPPTAQPVRAVAPAPVAVTTTSEKPDLRQQFLVRIQNLMPQALEVSVLDEGGTVTGLRLEPRGISRPVLVDRVGKRTHDLVAAGRVRIVPQS
jgi:type II secretory pathway component PulC